MSLDYTVDLEVKEDSYIDFVSAGDTSLRLLIKYMEQKEKTSAFDVVKSGIHTLTCLSFLTDKEKEQIAPILKRLGARVAKAIEEMEE